jgi:hypothetical protein
MSDEFVLHFEHARNLFDESDMIALPEPEQAQQLALTGIGRALLAIAGELRTLNSDRSQWYREVLEVLTAAKEPGPCPNPGPATGSGTYEVRPCQLRAGHAGFHEDGDGLSWPGRTVRSEES